MTEFPKSLASNRFFDEYVLVDPTNFERMRQRGSGKLDYNEAFDERLFAEPRNDMVPDDDPRIERLKAQSLLTHNDRDTVLQFSRMRQLQKRLDQHLAQGQPLPPGVSLYNITEAIRKIKLSYRDKFARMLGKTTTTRIIDQTPAAPASQSAIVKKKKKKKPKTDTTKTTQLDDSRPAYISAKTWSEMSDATKQIISQSSPPSPSSIKPPLESGGDSNATGDGSSSGSSSADTSSTDGSDPDTVSDKSDDDDDDILPPATSFSQGVGSQKWRETKNNKKDTTAQEKEKNKGLRI